MSHVYKTVCFCGNNFYDNEFQSTTITCLNERANLNLKGSLFGGPSCTVSDG